MLSSTSKGYMMDSGPPCFTWGSGSHHPGPESHLAAAGLWQGAKGWSWLCTFGLGPWSGGDRGGVGGREGRNRVG